MDLATNMRSLTFRVNICSHLLQEAPHQIVERQGGIDVQLVKPEVTMRREPIVI